MAMVVADTDYKKRELYISVHQDWGGMAMPPLTCVVRSREDLDKTEVTLMNGKTLSLSDLVDRYGTEDDYETVGWFFYDMERIDQE